MHKAVISKEPATEKSVLRVHMGPGDGFFDFPFDFAQGSLRMTTHFAAGHFRV